MDKENGCGNVIQACELSSEPCLAGSAALVHSEARDFGALPLGPRQACSCHLAPSGQSPTRAIVRRTDGCQSRAHLGAEPTGVSHTRGVTTRLARPEGQAREATHLVHEDQECVGGGACQRRIGLGLAGGGLALGRRGGFGRRAVPAPRPLHAIAAPVSTLSCPLCCSPGSSLLLLLPGPTCLPVRRQVSLSLQLIVIRWGGGVLLPQHLVHDLVQGGAHRGWRAWGLFSQHWRSTGWRRSSSDRGLLVIRVISGAVGCVDVCRHGAGTATSAATRLVDQCHSDAQMSGHRLRPRSQTARHDTWLTV